LRDRLTGGFMPKKGKAGAAKKRNQHYVPKSWIKRFACAKGRIYAWDGQKVRHVAASKIMSEDWLYTIFDNTWRSSDALEDALSTEEGKAATLVKRLSGVKYPINPGDRDRLCNFLALQACRHPDVMNRGYRRARELGDLIASAHAFPSVHDFALKAANFGIPAGAAEEMYKYLRTVDPSRLHHELEELKGLSEQDPQLPIQDALRAKPQIAQALARMTFTLLDAPSGCVYILGDTPLPQDLLGHGFSVPLSKSLAIDAAPNNSSQTIMARRLATKAEVNAVNRAQWENSLHIVIGPDASAFLAL
jgi:Protein of unknown function (DUF4238)